jgi:hypothetical protein
VYEAEGDNKEEDEEEDGSGLEFPPLARFAA